MVIRPTPKTSQIRTVRGVVQALGGTSKTAALIPNCSPQSISNAIARGFLPPSTFLILTDALRARRMTAPPTLWQIVPPRKRYTSR